MLTEVSRLPHVGRVASPYAAGGARQISRSGTIAYATVTYDEQANSLPLTSIKRVIRVARSAADRDLQVQLGGQATERTDMMGPGGLGFGILAAAIVLLLVFGSVLAAVLPLLTAGFALATGVAFIGLLSKLISMPSFSEQLALLIGLGVGVDYALFIVTRYRQAMARGKSSVEAIMESLDTSGRAVLFAGITVCIALLGMLTLGLSFLSGVGIAATIVVAFTVLAATTLLPALLGFFGPRTLTRRARRAIAAGELTRNDESPAWARWAATLRAHPALLAAGAAVVMLVIAIPFGSIRLGSTDAGSDPTNTTTRHAYDLLAKGFGPGFNGPLQLVANVSGPGQSQQFQRVLAAVARTPDVVSVTPARLLPHGVATADAVEKGSPQAASTSDLISTLRDRAIPAAAQGRVRVLIGGQTAIFKDFSSVLAGKLPLFIGVVVLLSFLLLMAVFRSLLIPLMAAVMNLLSVSAAFGVVTAVFQWGWLASVIGVDQTGPIAAFLPVIVFAILFGLSMDYEVFLVSRIYEEWQHRRDNTEAVTHGLAATGRTITAAASIMVLVFAAFVLGGELTIKLFGRRPRRRRPARRTVRPKRPHPRAHDRHRRAQLEDPGRYRPAPAPPQRRGSGRALVRPRPHQLARHPGRIGGPCARPGCAQTVICPSFRGVETPEPGAPRLMAAFRSSSFTCPRTTFELTRLEPATAPTAQLGGTLHILDHDLPIDTLVVLATGAGAADQRRIRSRPQGTGP